MRLGQLEVGPGRDLGPPRGVLVRRHLEPGEFDLHSRKLGLVLVLDRQRVIDVLGICLAHVHGQLCVPFMLHPRQDSQSHLHAWAGSPALTHFSQPKHPCLAVTRAHFVIRRTV